MGRCESQFGGPEPEPPARNAVVGCARSVTECNSFLQIVAFKPKCAETEAKQGATSWDGLSFRARRVQSSACGCAVPERLGPEMARISAACRRSSAAPAGSARFLI